jgi:PKD repeat protein
MVGPDPVLQDQIPSSRSTATIGQNFAGVTNLNSVAPPDTDGDVSSSYYFQMINLSFAIWDKNGTLLMGPFDNQTIWEGFDDGQPFDNANDGDPIVLYDEYADRWLVSQFAINTTNNLYYELVAISTTNDPTGSYYRYAFEFTNMPDYPKFGVWADGYYLAVNQFANASSWAGGGISILDRDAMINGDASATMVFFNLGTSYGSLLPADCDGPTLPPSGAPNYFMNLGTNSLRIWEAHVDWNNTANSTVTLKQTLTTQAYSYSGIVINQQGTGQTLDALADRLMYRLQYRNFGTHQVLMANHTVNANSGQAGIRWYEVRKTTGNWSIYQQGTFAPADGVDRWMASVAMNGNGAIGIGYSASGSSLYPSIRCAGQTAGAPQGLGVLDVTETTIKAGTASQTGVSRWGDYSMCSVDPSDDQTFWFTTEYTTGSWNWKTQIASFSLDAPPPVAPVADFSATPTLAGTGQNVNFSDESLNTPTSWNWTFSGGTPSTSTVQNPVVVYNTPGTYTVSLTATNAYGSDTKTVVNYITVEETPITYCASNGTNSSYEWISNVQFGTFSNSSGASGYTDFTSQTVSMEAGGSVTVNLTPGFSGSTYIEFWKVWIDYNQNGDFTDAGEEVFSGSGSSAVSGNFTVNAAASGTTRMRVSMKWNAAPSPCETFSYGEVEDYTVSFTTETPIAPVADFLANNTTIGVGGVVAFTDLSTNVPTSWAWTFAGGTPASSTAQTPSVQYFTAGTYTVSLIATNDGGSDTETKTDYISVIPLPIADFTANQTVINAGQSVQFTDLSTNATSYSWTFSGGTPSTSTAQNPSVTYNTPGTYTVTLIASNAGGSDTETKTAYITVNTVVVTPIAEFTANTTSITEGGSVQFTDQSTNNPTSWAWTFTGGTPATSAAQNPSVTYSTAGTYTVSLTATNSAGSNTMTKTNYITVSPAPTSVQLSYTDFESGWGIWKDGGSDCALYTGGTFAFGGSNAANIQDNSSGASSFYMINGVDVHTPGYVHIQVEFYFVSIGLSYNEDFWVQYFNGTTWQTVAAFASGVNFNNNTFYVATVNIYETSYNFPTNMKLRFMCDASSNMDDIYIDNVKVTASTQVMQTNGLVKLGDLANIEPIGIADEYELSLFPNPASETLNIMTAVEGNMEIAVYNTTGHLVYNGMLMEGTKSINISYLQKGLYVVKIKVGGETFTNKLIKQ